VIQVAKESEAMNLLGKSGVLVRTIGQVDATSERLEIGRQGGIGVDELMRAWRGALDW
jgi:hypothetical protein